MWIKEARNIGTIAPSLHPDGDNSDTGTSWAFLSARRWAESSTCVAPFDLHDSSELSPLSSCTPGAQVAYVSPLGTAAREH